MVLLHDTSFGLGHPIPGVFYNTGIRVLQKFYKTDFCNTLIPCTGIPVQIFVIPVFWYFGINKGDKSKYCKNI